MAMASAISVWKRIDRRTETMSDERKLPTSFDELYPGRFLKAGLLGGKKWTLTIKAVDLEELEGQDGPKKKCIIYFRETDLALVAAKTNGLCLRDMFGSKLSEWIGKQVTIFPTIDPRKGDCIRVWGSPDIPAEREIEISLARRKPFKMTMRKTPRRGQGDNAPEPGSDG
jgi:hypothetical protein